MKKILVLGAGGQLGEAVVQQVTDTVRLVTKTKEELNLTNSDTVLAEIDALQPDVIINCAAYTAVDLAESEKTTAFSVNAESVSNLAKNTTDTTRIVHISTDFVFSKKVEKPYLPSDNTCPNSVYGESKLEGERLLQQFRKHNYIILRTSWLYSALGNNFVLTMLRLMESREELGVVNDQYGSPTSADSLAHIIWQLAMVENAEGIFHWSDCGVISWYDFAVEIYRQARESGLLSNEVTIKPITTLEYPTPAKRPEYSALDSTQTEELLGVKSAPWQIELAKVLNRIKELRS